VREQPLFVMYDLNNSVTAASAQAYAVQLFKFVAVQQANALRSDDFEVVYYVHVQLLVSLCGPTNRGRSICVQIN